MPDFGRSRPAPVWRCPRRARGGRRADPDARLRRRGQHCRSALSQSRPEQRRGMHIFDRLVERDGRARPRPSLAESYRALSETLWEFKLPAASSWHDGRDFTADDVVFTFERAPQVRTARRLGGFLRAISRVEVVDPHTPGCTRRSRAPAAAARPRLLQHHRPPSRRGAQTEDYNPPRRDRHRSPPPCRFSLRRPGRAAAQTTLIGARRSPGRG